MDLSDLIYGDADGRLRPPPPAVQATVANYSEAEGLFVIVPEYDAHLEFGPCEFVGPAPTDGDPCLVIFDTERQPWAILPGVSGGPGATGPPGPTGPAGPTGPTGATGPAASVPIVTALPGSPVEGQEVIYNDNRAQGNYPLWRLRYSASRWGDGRQWEFVGGTPAYVEVTTDDTFSQNVGYVDASVAGPLYNVPLAGAYYYDMSADYYSAGSNAATQATMGLSIAGAAPATPHFTNAYVTSPGGAATLGRQALTAVIAANAELRMKYLSGVSGGTAHIRGRVLRVWPKRVG